MAEISKVGINSLKNWKEGKWLYFHDPFSINFFAGNRFNCINKMPKIIHHERSYNNIKLQYQLAPFI